ncbi:hypothetical protein D9758_000181 [Tetrapyrgos nigripes]|uniref:Uncharacterized protein n=1 Tax=Tetrapyrgos nigripes TaxID=182062 RepID=A0A8H5LZH3_9AGAR|nr:hypothetical protein D9758_000181 [Tetrapyrgos nigripes]
MNKGNAKLEPNSRQHRTATSIDTNASGLESTLSFNGLSQFPQPPSSIPTTPITASPSRSIFAPSPHRNPFSPSPSSSGSVASPHDWHEGASSIDVDAAEDRLLSTSFITSLLQGSPDSGFNSRRVSVNSDALSGFSEMTYPPANHTSEQRPPLPNTSSSSRLPPSRPNGARPPPPSSFPSSRAFPPIAESPGFVSDDSDTLYSAGHDDPTIIRSASITRGPRLQGASVVGLAPARLHSIPSASNLRPSTIMSSEYGEKGQYAEYNMVNTSLSYSPALPSTAGFLHEKAQSVRSTKSFATSVISRVSSAARSITRNLPWRLKPLPPVPVIPHIPIADQRVHQMQESSLPLPHLVARANALDGMLEKGYHPHQSLNSYYKADRVASGCEESDITSRNRTAPWDELPDSPKSHPASKLGNKKRYLIILAIFVVIAAGAIGAGVGVSVSRSRESSGESLPTCSSPNITGQACDLDATCVCTSTTGCQGIAQSIVDLIPTMNELFSTNHTNATVYNSLWFAVGSPSGDSCARQAILIDAGPALSSITHPNRTRWTQAALLWNTVQSQDADASQSLRDFIKSAPWSSIDSSDGPVDDHSLSFSTSASGFIFNFASQTVDPQSADFKESGQPVNEQISRVGDTALQALNRMYSFGYASSTQQQGALSSYWTSILQQKASDLDAFKSAIISSPMFVTFDATFKGVSGLMTNSSTAPFPPPLACYPKLNNGNSLDSYEQTVFGLSSLQEASKFDTSCYPDRPIYGILNVLRLRLPFADSSDSGSPKQAAALDRDVNPRAILRSGRLFSGLADSSNSTASSITPRSYGTLNNINHVLLAYLLSIPDVNLAKELVTFLLSSPTSPPSNTSLLSQSISSIPTLEVAVFGSVLPPDLDYAVSSFSTSNGSLFFGSDDGKALREWAIAGTRQRVIWAEDAVSAQVAQDSSFSDDTFNNIWNNASAAINSNMANVGVSNITTALEVTGKLS